MSYPRDYIDLLNSQDRVLLAARMLPMDRPLTEEQIDQARRTYLAFTNKEGVFDSQVALEVDLSPSVISQWKAGKYEGDVDKITHTLNHWMERHARSKKVRLPAEYVPTQVAQDMRTIAQVAHETCSMAAIVVPSGAGKTMVMEVLSSEMRGAYLYCDEDLTPKAFYQELARAIGEKFGSLNKADIRCQIISKLKGSNRPIFLDEAHRLGIDVFSRIRSIHDQAGVPIIMAGTHEIMSKINDQANGRGQLASRCLRYNALEHVHNVESGGGEPGSKLGRHLFTRDEIRAFFDKMKIKLDTEAFELLWAIACLPNRGCLRTTRRIVQLVNKNWSGEAVTRKRILWAMQLLFGLEGQIIVATAQKHLSAYERKEVA